MTDERVDPYHLIGLHKLAETQGDTMVPELHAALSRLPYPEVEEVPDLADLSRPAAQILPFVRRQGQRLGRALAAGGEVNLFRPPASRRP